jgi:hypothetical protein
VWSILAQRLAEGKRRVEEILWKNRGRERFIFLARSRRTAQRRSAENLFPVGAVFRSAKNHVAMSLGFERDELGNDFILSISEEVGVMH